MAALVYATNATVYERQGDAEQMVLYLIKNVDTLDTIDLTTDFRKIKAATWIPSGDLTTGVVATVAGTVVTLTLATMSDENLWLLVVGVKK